MANTSNVVVVTMNYRFGVLGYIYTAGFGGNFGLKDQIAVLKWVQRNIASFGGDAEKVTLFGQSAGATSTSVLISSAGAAGLFSQAIIQSNPFGLQLKSMYGADACVSRC